MGDHDMWPEDSHWGQPEVDPVHPTNTKHEVGDTQWNATVKAIKEEEKRNIRALTGALSSTLSDEDRQKLNVMTEEILEELKEEEAKIPPCVGHAYQENNSD